MTAVEPTYRQAGLGAGLLESTWRYRWAILLAGILLGVLAYVLASLQPVAYQASTQLVLGAPQAQGLFSDRRLDATPNMTRATARMTSTPVLERAVERLGAGFRLAEVRDAVRAEELPTLEAIELRATWPDPEGAAAVANAVADSYRDIVGAEVQAAVQTALTELNDARTETRNDLAELQRRLDIDPDDGALQAELEVASQQLVALSTSAQQLAVEAALYGSGVEILERATPPAEPVRPRPTRTAIVAAVLGMCAAGALAWWRADRHQIAEDSVDVAEVLGAPVLGEIPNFGDGRRRTVGERPMLSSLDPVIAEAYQFVLSSMLFALRDMDGRSVAVTSVAPGDGKTVTAMNLAFAAAQSGSEVTLLDGDERVRGLSVRFRMEKHAGLAEMVDARAPLAACRHEQRDVGSRSSVQVVPVGRLAGRIPGLFRRAEFKRAMTVMSNSADLLVVDTPPLLAVSDVLQIAEAADGVVVVVRRGTPLSRLRESRERLDLVGTPILGFVFNRAKRRAGHGSYERYYSGEVGNWPPAVRSAE